MRLINKNLNVAGDVEILVFRWEGAFTLRVSGNLRIPPSASVFYFGLLMKCWGLLYGEAGACACVRKALEDREFRSTAD